jgi:hypothetical protein
MDSLARGVADGEGTANVADGLVTAEMDGVGEEPGGAGTDPDGVDRALGVNEERNVAGVADTAGIAACPMSHLLRPWTRPVPSVEAAATASAVIMVPVQTKARFHVGIGAGCALRCC